MAAIVVSRTLDFYDPNPRTPYDRLMRAMANQDTYAEAAQRKILGMPQFVVYGTTDTNTSTSPAINLSTEGVTFPDGTCRLIRVRAYNADTDEMGLIELKAIVDGGTTPIVTQDAADADPVTDIGTPATLNLAVTNGEVILHAVGIADVDHRWVIEVYVEDLVSLSYIPTT